MKLLTKEIINRMPGPREQDGKGEDAIVHLNLFTACGTGTWLITEAWHTVEDAKGEYKDVPLKYELKEGEKILQTILYGLCHIYEWEWGPVDLAEIEEMNRSRSFPIIERETSQSDGKHTVKQLKR